VKTNGDKSVAQILKRDVIGDQLDPRMIEFRESYGEFKPGCKRETIRLEITEYAANAAQCEVTTKFGYYEGEPPPEYRQLIRKLVSEVSSKTNGLPPLDGIIDRP
jgi:hypothetical protein